MAFKNQTTNRMAVYAALALGLLAAYLILRGSSWQGSTQLHTLMEVVASGLAATVGVFALVRYYSRPNNTFLFIGAGFMGTALLDGYHAVVTSAYFASSFPSAPPSLIPWSWVASRLFLSVLLTLSWLAWRRENRLGNAGTISRRSVYVIVGVLTLGSFLLFALVPLPRAYYPEFIFHRPEEFLPAGFFLLALVGYLSKGHWKHDDFEHWLVLSLIVGLMGQAVFMSFSGRLFDMEFDAAHTLKKVSYLLVLVGLLISMYHLFKREEQQKVQMEVEIYERIRAEGEIKRLLRDNEMILNSTAEGIYGLDKHGAITFVNPAVTGIVGWDEAELIGQAQHSRLHHTRHDGSPNPWETSPIKTTLEDGIIHHETSDIFWRSDGASIPVEYTSTPIKEREQIVGAVVTFRDITERLAVDRMKDEFVSVVSHELRTPLTSIRGSLGLIAGGVMGALPEKAQDMAEIAVSNTDRLIRLINDILDIERMESGRSTMERVSCDSAVLMVQAAELTRDMAEDAGVTLSVSPEPVQIWADPDRIVQTFTNLLSNAIKFSPRGSTVELLAHRHGSRVLFQVKDQGRGIPAENLESIFERFQQVDASDSREKGGTGLGLVICRSIVQQHGGRIWVHSAAGEGSTFFFNLPVLKEEVRTVSIKETDGPLVLICDDDQSIRELVAEILLDRGYRVIGVRSAKKAIEQAGAMQPSVILLDLVMPDMDGWEALAVLKEREDTKDIPVVILSVLSSSSANFPMTDVAGWVQKPLDEETLFETLSRCVSEHNVVNGVNKVLLVEDDIDLARQLTTILERHDIEVFHAQTGAEAIDLSQQLLPDLLILDLILPGDDGFAVVKWLRRHNHLHQVPVVVYSVKDLDDTERERLKLGRTEFLSKDLVGPEELEQRVVDLLNHVVSNGRRNGRPESRKNSDDGR